MRDILAIHLNCLETYQMEWNGTSVVQFSALPTLSGVASKVGLRYKDVAIPTQLDLSAYVREGGNLNFKPYNGPLAKWQDVQPSIFSFSCCK